MIVFLLKMLLFWLIGMVLSLYIHELGHVLVGIVNGWRFMLFTVGPLKIYRPTSEEKMTISFEKNVMNWFGVGAVVPKGKSNDNLDIWAKVLIGGPAASLAAAVLLLVSAMIFRSFFMLMFGLVSLAIGLVNYIPLPFRTGFFYNDGKRFKRIKSGGTAAEEEREIMNIIEKSVVYGEDAVVAEDECIALIKSEDPIYRYYGYYVLYYSAKDHDKTLAGKYRASAETLTDEVPRTVTKMFFLDDRVG